MTGDPTTTAVQGNWLWRGLAATLILGAVGLRLALLVSDCPLDLAPDEAHYWDWSRHLDWSYYSKGPLVAYLIRAGCAVAGEWSRQLTGSAMVAVRLPAVLCGGLLLASLYVLTVQVFGREKLAAGVVAMALAVPLVTAGSSLMTIDAPFTCCWGWALVLGHRAIFRGSAWAWPATGLVVGLGILAKYTMVLWLPAVALFLATSPAHRRLLARPGFWVMTAVAAACCLPIVMWNVLHDWVSLRHVAGQAGVRQVGLLSLGPLGYLGTQFVVLLGFWFVAWAAAMVAHRPWREEDDGVRYLWWPSAVVFGVFLGFSLRTPLQPNWPAAAYVSGLVLAAVWIARQLRSPRVGYRRAVACGLAAVCGLGLVISGLVYHRGEVYPLLARLTGPAPNPWQLPLRRFDPTCRLRGWRALAAEVDRQREVLRSEGVEPLLAASSWSLPGELAFYCEGQPTVYSLGRALGDRWSQYDLWHPNPLQDAAVFRGRTFVLVGDAGPELLAAFDRVEEPYFFSHAEHGQPVATWLVRVCRGYRGFPATTAAGAGKF